MKYFSFNNKFFCFEVFNIAFGESTSLNGLFSILKENLLKFDKSIQNIKPLYGPNRKGDIPHSLASINKAKLLLNYNPKYDIKSGIEKACQWYWENLKK